MAYGMNLNVLFHLCMIVLHALMCMHRSDYDIVLVKPMAFKDNH